MTSGAYAVARLRSIAIVRPSNVDKKSLPDQVSVRLCNYTDVYYKDEIRYGGDYMQATATPEQIATFTLHGGDVVITKDSETPEDIGVAAYVPDDLDGVLCGYHLSLVRPDRTRVHPRFLFWALKSAPVRSSMSAAALGITRFGLRSVEIANLEVPLPDFKAQIRVADFLDRETARIDEVVMARRRLLGLVQGRIRAAADSLLGEWRPSARVKSVVHRITSGPRGWAQYAAQEGDPFLRITNVSRESIELSKDNLLRVTAPAGPEAERTRLAKGDVVVSITADVGSVGVIDEQLAGGYVSQHLALLRPNQDWVVPRWLALALFSSAAQTQLDSARYGGTKTQLALDDVGGVRLPLPTLRQQRAALSRWSEMEAASQALEKAIQGQIAVLRERRDAIIMAAVQSPTPIQP